MKDALLKSGSFLLIISGEVLCIYSEVLAAKIHSEGQQAFLHTFGWACLLYAISGALLIGGYMIGYKAFANIWIVTVVSLTSLLILEPTIADVVFREQIERGPLIGLCCGVSGFLAALFL